MSDGRVLAGGVLIQHLPEGEEGRERLHVRHDHPEWEHVRILAETLSPAELADPALALEEIVWRLFHEENQVRIESGERADQRLPLRSRIISALSLPVFPPMSGPKWRMIAAILWWIANFVRALFRSVWSVWRTKSAVALQ